MRVYYPSTDKFSGRRFRMGKNYYEIAKHP
jgi:hypothetical protein